MPKTETREDDAAVWLTPVNWEEDPAIKAERRRTESAQNQNVESEIGLR